MFSCLGDRERMIFQGLKECFIIAEISANHGQDFKTAVKLIRLAKQCGADAVKFQCYTPDTLTIDARNKYFQIRHPKWGGQTLYELYERAYTPWDWFPRLKKVADQESIEFFSTAFDRTSLDFLEDLGVRIHKIASFELVDIPLIKHVASTGKPLIMSTGMASVEEIRDAVRTARRAGTDDLALLKCVSSYPASPDDMHLRTIEDLGCRFKCVPGLSDHTLGIGVAVASVALGAKIIEKHFTFSRKIVTPDSFFSLEPLELKELVDNVRLAERAMGRVSYEVTDSEKHSLKFRRSLFVVEDIRKGEVFTENHIRSIRPGHGLAPKHWDAVIGRTAKMSVKRGTPLQWLMVK